MSDERESPHEEERKAMARIGLGNDGRLMLRNLYRVLDSVTPPGAEVGTLWHAEGRRNLARELIEALEGEHAGRRSDEQSARPELGRKPEPVRAGGWRGARRPVPADRDEA